MALSKSSILGFVLIIAGGVMLAGSCFDAGHDEPQTVIIRGDTVHNVIRDTVMTCADLGRPPGTSDTSCLTSREIMDVDGKVNNRLLFAGGFIVLLLGLGVVTGFLSKFGDNDPPATAVP